VQDVETSHAELAEVTRQNDSEYADALQIKGGVYMGWYHRLPSHCHQTTMVKCIK